MRRRGGNGSERSLYRALARSIIPHGMFKLVVFLHMLGATIWTGGHLVLATVILPKALRKKSIEDLRQFEAGYERIGIPALAVQVVTGFWLAHRYVPDVSNWFRLDNPVSQIITAKLAMLATTVVLAVDARLRLIPKLSPERLPALAWHVVPVTILSLMFVYAGVAFRTGSLF